MAGSFFPAERRRILDIAATYHWPVVGQTSEFAEGGALISYGADRKALFRRSAYYVERILKGARPTDLPIEQPTTFELVVNRMAAGRLGLEIPKELLLRADRVIE